MSGPAEKKFDLATQGRICALCPNMCRFLCPVAAVEKLEAVTPRGKATLTLTAERGDAPLDSGAADTLYHCASCKVCREWCPSNVDLPEVMAGLRARAAAEGLSPTSVVALKDRLLRDRSLHRPAPELAAGLARYREMVTPGARVLYFAGCSTAALYPEVVAATLRLFEAAGVGVAMLETEECCGLPLDQLGFRDLAAEFAGGLAAAVQSSGATTVVSGCPMCVVSMKERFPALGVTLGATVLHVTEFLAGLSEDGAPGRLAAAVDPEAGPVTYHDPCYLGRHAGVYDAPRHLLSEVAGLELVEMEQSRQLAACCGGSAAVATAYPATATAIVERRLDEAGRTGARTLVTACPHCLEMFRPAAEGRGLTVLDVTEVLADKLGVLPRR